MDDIDFFKHSHEANSCSEVDVQHIARTLATEVRSGDRILLQGPMGVGKTTFTRALLEALGVMQPPEGSPSFAIAHEYQSPRGGIVHLDFYRLKSEAEIEDAGILAYYWERKLIVISEWLDSWPELEKQVLHSGRSWKIDLEYDETNLERRSIRIEFIP